MTTREIIEAYFEGLNQKQGWEDQIADNMIFVGVKTRTTDKNGYVETTRSFLRLVQSVRLTNLIVEGVQACVIAHYNLESPSGKTAESTIAEIFTVSGGKISSSTIFFDTVAFWEFIAKG